MEAARQRDLGWPDAHQPAARQIEPHEGIEADGDAQPGRRRLVDELQVVEALVGTVSEGRAGPPEPFRPEIGLMVRADQGMVAEILRPAQAFRAGKEVRAGDRACLDRKEALAQQAGPGSSSETNGAIEIRARLQVGQIARGLQLDLHPAQPDAALHKPGQQPVGGECRHDADLEQAAARRTLGRRRRLAHDLPGGAELGEILFACFGEGKATRQAMKEPHAEMLLEDVNPATDGGHGEVQRRCRSGEAEGTRHRDEGFDGAQGKLAHGVSLSLRPGLRNRLRR